MLDVWRARFHELSAHVERFRSLLSADERARADAYLVARERDRFTIGRGALRETLAQYLGDAAETLRFVYGPQGKPGLAEAELRFNASASGNVVCIAVADAEVGVDVEQIRGEVEFVAIARTVFGEDTAAMLAGLPAQERVAEFYRRWTRMEAILKMRGTGFGGSDRVAFSAEDGRGCDVRAFAVAEGYAACVATMRDCGPITIRDIGRG
jgi:4'-phosphopantetheinyl transferase